jgi:glycosyltransferase involved in cell wall biosynthesis
MKKLTLVISHPIQYHAPLYTRIAQRGLFDLHVIYHNDRGVRTYFDPMANATVAYDNNLLDGYSHEFMTQGDPQGWAQKLKHATLPGLEERILASHPSAVYFHGYSHFSHVRAAFRLERAGVRIFLRGENEDVIPRTRWRLLLREIFLKQAFQRCAAFLWIGEENRNFYMRRGVPPHKLYFVPYSADNTYFGINLSEQERTAIRQKVCRKHSIDPASVIFVNICKHRIEKRPMDLIRAFVQAQGKLAGHHAATLLMVGDGPENAAMRQAVTASGVGGVCFTGFVKQSEMRELLLASDYCVNPGEEPWGCTFNEALPAGLGLISSDRVVGWPDMVRIGENGFIHRCGCVDSLAALLTQCARNPQWRTKFAANSREIARLYSYDTCVDGLHAALSA